MYIAGTPECVPTN